MIEYILSFVPLIGTSIGAFLGIHNTLSNKFEEQEDVLVAVATGILGSICFNLLLEASEQYRYKSMYIGIIAGLVFIISMNTFSKHTNKNTKSKLFWAMLIHNIPEGILVGIALAESNLMLAIPLLISISLQNIPDGLVVSMPLVSTKGRKKALLFGINSGIVEPIASILIILSTSNASNIGLFEPFLIGFSFSSILIITFELLQECINKKTAFIAFILATIFNRILNF